MSALLLAIARPIFASRGSASSAIQTTASLGIATRGRARTFVTQAPSVRLVSAQQRAALREKVSAFALAKPTVRRRYVIPTMGGARAAPRALIAL